MLLILAGVTLLLTFADHWTTYLCLRESVAGWEVLEANPIADWLFSAAGLLPGLMIDTFITLFAITFLVRTRRVADAFKLVLLFTIAATTGSAVINNLHAIQTLGLSPLGVG